jgi:CheY-like chemotaxis protein
MAKRSTPIPRLAPLRRIAAYPVRVLVVAADDNWRGMIAALLADEGFEVQEADNVDSALAELAQPWPEVLVLDLSTPHAGGRNNDAGARLLQALAERPDRPGMVAFTIDPDSASAHTAREFGAVAVLDRRAEHAELVKLPVGESLGWKVCSAWHWRQRQLEAINSSRGNVQHRQEPQ